MLTEDDKQWIKGQLEQRVESLEERFEEQLQKLETTLLTEFHKWASPVELRQRSHAAALRAYDAEMEALNDRGQEA